MGRQVNRVARVMCRLVLEHPKAWVIGYGNTEEDAKADALATADQRGVDVDGGRFEFSGVPERVRHGG